MLESDPRVTKVIFPYEATFKESGRVNLHNCVYWCGRNTHQLIAEVPNVWGVTVWASRCGLGTMDQLSGPKVI